MKSIETAATSPTSVRRSDAADPDDYQSDVEAADAVIARQDAPPEETAVDKIANLATRALSHWLAKLGALAGTLLVLLSVYNTITGDLKAHTESQISGLEARIDDRFSGLEARIDGRISSLEARIDDRFGGVDDRFGGVDDQFSGLEARIDGRISSLAQLMDTRFEAVNERLDRQDASIARLSDDIRAVRADISSLSERVAVVESAVLQDD